MCHHRNDFVIPVEWHFSAISHEKGAFDGLGGTVKRLVARASPQMPYNVQIMTPRQLFDLASTNVPAVPFGYCSMEDYEREQHNLEQRFQQSRTIPGTRKLHSFIPISKSTVRVSFYSASNNSREERVTLTKIIFHQKQLLALSRACVMEIGSWLVCCKSSKRKVR